MSTIDLAGLLAAAPLRLRVLVAPEAPGPRPVAWVHSTDLPTPARFLRPATAVLTTGQQLSEPVGPRAAEQYVRGLVRGHVAALGFGVGVVHGRTPPELIAACRDQGLPLFEVPFEVPFLAVAAHVVQAQEDARLERAMWTQRAIAELTRSARRRDGLDSVLSVCARLLRSPVALLMSGRVRSWDGAGERLAVHTRWEDAVPHAEALLAQGRPAVTSADGPHGRAHLYTVGAVDATSGVLAWMPETEPQEAERAVIAAAAGLAGLVVGTADRVWTAIARARAAAFELALAGAPGPARRVMESLGGGDGHALYVIARIDGELAGRLGGTAVREVTVLPDSEAGRTTVVIDDAPGARERVRALMATTARTGLSHPHPLTGLGEAHREATAAMHGAQRGALVRFGDVADDPWSHLTLGDGRCVIADAYLDRLRPRREELIPVLRTWLECGGQWDPAARLLGMHRHTLRRLVEEAGQTLGRDLGRPQARAELTWALTVIDQDIR